LAQSLSASTIGAGVGVGFGLPPLPQPLVVLERLLPARDCARSDGEINRRKQREPSSDLFNHECTPIMPPCGKPQTREQTGCTSGRVIHTKSEFTDRRSLDRNLCRFVSISGLSD